MKAFQNLGFWFGHHLYTHILMAFPAFSELYYYLFSLNWGLTMSCNEDVKKIGEKSLLENIPKDLHLSLLDNPYESLILIDMNGNVQFLSRVYEKAFGIKIADAIGKPLIEIHPGTKLLKVLKTGRAEIGRSMVINDRRRIVSRIPLKKGGELIGAVGKLMSMYPEKLKGLYDKIANLENHLSYYRKELLQKFGSRYNFESIIGESEPIQQAKELSWHAAQVNSAVLITGESGTGKELFSHAIHQASSRAENPFISVNCSTIPKELIESELFGYEPGSFTGARIKGKIGKFELAHKGTIFLDEIGDMSLNMQVKLLRVLQEKEIEKIGASTTKKINFRVISATNRDVDDLVKKELFRLDLFYRINVITVDLPPLRNMKEDIPLLAYHFLTELNRDLKKNITSISDESLALMKKYSWPGNVRELRNVIERALIVCNCSQIEVEDLPSVFRELLVPSLVENNTLPLLRDLLEMTEKKAIAEVLKLAGYNKMRASKLLGIHRTGLYQKMKKYNLL